MIKPRSLIEEIKAHEKTMASVQFSNLQMRMSSWNSIHANIEESLSEDTQTAIAQLVEMLYVEIRGRRREYVISRLHSRLTTYRRTSEIKDLLEYVERCKHE